MYIGFSSLSENSKKNHQDILFLLWNGKIKCTTTFQCHGQASKLCSPSIKRYLMYLKALKIRYTLMDCSLVDMYEIFNDWWVRRRSSRFYITWFINRFLTSKQYKWIEVNPYVLPPAHPSTCFLLSHVLVVNTCRSGVASLLRMPWSAA